MSQHTILVIDDDNLVGRITSDILSKAGYCVTLVSSGEAGYQAACASAPALIVTDLVLPGLDGHGLCRQLRKHQPTQFIPILMLTSQDDLANKIAGFEAGADDYLIKPYESQELVYRVKKLLERAQAASRVQTAPTKRGEIIAFFGCKGGLGKTTIAVNTAVAMQKRGKGQVAIFDADFFFGDVSVHLNQPLVHSVLDLVKYIDELDPALAQQVLAVHSTGLRVLLSPFRPEEAEYISAEHVRKVLDFLAQLYDTMVVDCQPAYDERTLMVLEQADQIMLVISPEIGTLKNTSHCLRSHRRRGASWGQLVDKQGRFATRDQAYADTSGVL